MTEDVGSECSETAGDAEVPDLPLSAVLAAMLAEQGGAPIAASPSLEHALAELCESTRRALPGLIVDPGGIFAAVARVVASSPDPVAALAEVRAADLVLASACAGGDPAALALFRERFGRDLEVTLQRTVADPASRDDLLQQIWEKLFVAAPGARPRILDYSGRGELRGWLRSTAVRSGLNHVSRGQRERPVEDALFAALPDDHLDPEMAHLKALYRVELKEAFGEAVRALTAQERNLLRYAAIEGLSIDAVAALHGVHRATAARWIQSARGRLVAEVRSRLASRLRVSRGEVDSILRLVQSGMSVSLERHLAPTTEPARG